MTEKTTPTIGQGILHPAMTYRWVFVIKAKNQDSLIHITKNMVRCEINYVEDTLQIFVEENIQGTVSDVIYDLVKRNNFTCELQTTTGNDTIAFSLEFLRSNVISHSLVYDYAGRDVLTHKMTIKFGDMRQLVPIPPEKAQ